MLFTNKKGLTTINCRVIVYLSINVNIIYSKIINVNNIFASTLYRWEKTTSNLYKKEYLYEDKNEGYNLCCAVTTTGTRAIGDAFCKTAY